MKKRIHDVLVLTSLNDAGKMALKQAMILQETLGFRVFILYVLPAVSYIRQKLFARKVSENEEEALAKLTDFAHDFFKGNIPQNVILKVMSGDIVSTLIKETYHDNFHFIILKRSDSADGSPSVIGQKEIDQIISHAHCPVLSINKDTTASQIKNILIPIDITEGSQKRLLWASNLAKHTGAKIQIISALNIEMDEKQSLAYRNADSIREMLKERDIQCDVEMLKVHDQEKNRAVLKYIEDKNPDMVVIRKHHLTSAGKSGIGKFAHEIIHNSSVPVFTVSQKQQDIAIRIG